MLAGPQLADLELAYAPPFGSAKDPVNMAGFVAANVIRGDLELCHTQDVLNLRSDQMVLDVRNPSELASGSIAGALNIPLGELRDRIGELSKEKEFLVLCGVGQRAYVACRILSQMGFKCKDIAGGYKTYSAAIHKLESMPVPVKEDMRDDSGSCCSVPPPMTTSSINIVKTIDCCGLQCPGPIMRISQEIDAINDGEAITILSTDPGFASDIGPWCASTGNRLIGIVPDNGQFRATIVKGSAMQDITKMASSKNKTIVVFSNDFDRVLASFVIANGAAAMGSEVTMFFTFWGINALRKSKPVAINKNLIEKMFGAMMPRGADKLSMSKMNMGGMGLNMMKGIMKKKNVPSLPEFIESAQKAGVKLVVCTMSMDLMGIKREELIDGIEEGGVAMYLERAEAGNVNLFI